MAAIATTYPNPDTDGVACIIAYAEYLRSQKEMNTEPVFKGQLHPETVFVLKFFNVSNPKSAECCSGDHEIFLFDTHHSTQVEGFVDCSKVLEIYDHHPNGNPEVFPQAEIINELVGAAATLVAELFQKKQYNLSLEHAGLLYAAIISNTLDFTAPTTTDRDKQAATWLLSRINVPKNFAYLMFEARSNFDSYSTDSLIESDCKIFEIGGLKFAISQIEGVGVERVLRRDDVNCALTRLAEKKETTMTLLSAVDIYKQHTTIVPANEEVRTKLTEALGFDFTSGFAFVDKILLRKSDIVPPLKNLLEGE
jgi:manganese-dependent inorganic pyrophosphatase